MAVVNQYDFVGVDNDTSNGELNPFGAGNPLVVKPMLSNLYWLLLQEHPV